MKRILLFTMMCLFGLFSLNAQETISIGNGDVENYNVPIEAYYLCSYSQQSYSKDEIAAAGGEAGTITSIQYKVKGIATEITTRKLRVFIENVETEQEITFNSNTKKYHQLSNLDGLVYEGNYTFADGWNEIVFQTPFVYTGNHILITVLDDTKDSDNADIYFAIHSKSGYVDETAVNWTANGNSKDVIDPTTIDFGMPNAIRNDIKLTFAEGGEGGETPEPTPDPEPTLDLTKQYRVKATSLDKYFYVLDNDQHPSGPNGGVVVYQTIEDDNQLFTLEDAGDGAYYFKSASGYYIYCQDWNVDAYSATAKTALKMVDQGDGTFYLQNTNNNKYFKVEQVGGFSFPFCDCDGSDCTIEKWTLEAVDNGDEPEPTPTVPAAPVVTAEATSSTAATLTWEAVDGATSYNVYMLYTGGEYLHGTTSETSYSVPNYLVPGANNCFDVTAVNEVGESERTNVCVLTYPAAPQNLAATANETTITLTWDAVTGAESYNVYSGTETVTTALTEATFTTEELAAGEYCYTVTAVNASGESAASTEKCATIKEQGGDEPGDVVAGNVVVVGKGEGEPSSVLPFGATFGYSFSEQLYTEAEIGRTGNIESIAYKYSSGPACNRTVEVYIKHTTKDNFIDAYTWESVSETDKVYDGDIVVSGTADEWVTIDLDTPFAYTGGNIVVFVYDKTNSAASDYVYFYADANVKKSLYYSHLWGTLPTPSNMSGKGYASSNRNMIQFTFEATSTPEPQPFPAPQNLAVTDVTETSITLTWDAVDGAEDYYIYIDGALSANTNGPTSIVVGTSPNPALTPGTTYCFNVSAVKDNWDTESELSEQLCETTLASQIPLPATPQNLVAEATSETTISLTWDAVDGANQYVIYMKYNSEDYIRLGALTTNSYEVPGFSAGETVCFKVSAENGTGESDLTAEICATTLTPEPETPVVVLPYRLQSITGVNENDNLYYVYSEDESRVEKITKGSYATLVEYNEDGTVAKTTYVFMWNGAPDYSSDYTVTDYTYTDGVLTSYTETKNYNWRDPETSEYALSYNEDGTVAEVTVDNRKYAYEYEDGKLVKETYSYYDQWAYPEPGYVSEYIKEFEYDENGNCVTETKYNAYQNPPVAQSGVDYFYDLNVEADSVYVFAYPHEVLPARANLVTKAVTYYYNQDWETGEVTKGDFSVKTYNYNEEVVNAPVAPTNLVANVLNDTEVVLTWETLEEVESFKVYNGTELVSEGLVAKTDTVKGLEPLTEYTFTVVAVNGELESAASEAVNVTTYNLVNVNPAEIAFGKVIVGDYWLREQKSVEVSIDRFGKEVKAVKTDNKFFRMTSPELTADPIVTTINYNKNSEAGEYEGNLLVILASGDTVSFPLTATAYTPVTPDVFEHAQAIETVDGLFVDRPDFATLTDDYKLPGEDEDGNRPDAVYSFTLEEEASVEINVESDSWDGIYAIYKAPFEGNGPSTDNNVELTDRVYSTAFTYDFEDGGLEDFEIIDNDGDTEHTMKVEDGALVSWSYIYDYENWVTVVSYANECAVTKEAYNITEKSVLTFDARFKDGNGYGTYDQVTVQVTKDGETYTDIDWAVNSQYSAEFNTYRVDLGAKFAEKGLEYGEYRVALLYSSGSGSVAIDNLVLSERAWVYSAGDYYLVAAASGNFKVNVKSDALPELELDKEAHYRLVSREIDYAYERYNYASKIGTKVVNVNNSGDLDFLKYNDEGLLLGFVTCNMDENGGISDTLGVVEYIYEDSVLVGYREESVFMGQVQEKEYVFHYNAD